jgi:GTP-binding protein
LADIPGLIEGAHAGAGLGHQFLRHIERTRLLIHLLDGASADPLGDFEKINEELALFDPQLARKSQVVVLNKMDLPQTQELWPRVRREIQKLELEAMSISAVTGQGVPALLQRIVNLLDSLPKEKPVIEEEVKVFRLEEEEPFSITQEENGWRVRGAKVERVVAMTNWEYDEAVMRFQRILEAMGISAALEEAGVEVGDMVRIGDTELEWQ